MPIYEDIKNQLELEIYEGNFHDNAFFCRLDDICERFNVSKMTGYKALQRLKEEGAVFTKQGNGIYVNDVNKVYEKHSRNNYILICGTHYLGANSSYFSYRNEAVINFFQQKRMGVRFLARPSDDAQLSLNSCLEIDGLRGAIMDMNTWQERKAEFRKARIPVVTYNNLTGKPPASVNWNLKKIAKRISEYVKSCKIKSITLLLNEPTMSHIGSFLTEYLAGQKFSIKIIYNHSIKTGIETGRELLASSLPDAIFVEDDFVFIGMLMAFQRARIDVPGEVKMIAGSPVDSPLISGLGIPAIGCSPQKIGKTAAELLYKMTKNPKLKPQTLLVEPEFFIPTDTNENPLFSGVYL